MTEALIQAGVFALAAAISHWVGPWIVKQAVTEFTEELRVEDHGLPHAGLLIGRLERFLILLFIFADALTGVGFLLTAKSVFRFGDISDGETHRRTEYYLIGSLASFTVGIALAFAARIAGDLVR